MSAAELFRALGREPARLESLLRAGAPPDPRRLAGFEWRGYNVGLLPKLMGIQKFIKGFFAAADGVEGYNIPARSNGLDAPWEHRPSAESPKRFGFYRVARGDVYANAVLLDYGASRRNAFYRVERLLRDYLVQPDPAAPDVLLGKAYLALGLGRVFASFFVLERLRPTSWKP